MTWTDTDGWRVPYPSALADALRNLPGAEKQTPERLDQLARILVAVADGGKDEEQFRSRPASASATDGELKQLHDLCTKLADHIENMHQPSVSALTSQGVRLFELEGLLRSAAENARHVYGYTGAPESVPGRRASIAAPAVTEIAANVYRQVTGRHASYTSDPLTSVVSGDWPVFLSRVFAALYIPASAASQAKALAKNGAKIG